MISAGTKDKDVGIAVEPAKVRQGTGLKDTIPSLNNGDGLSNSTPDLYPGTRKVPGKEDDVQQPYPAPRQSVLKGGYLYFFVGEIVFCHFIKSTNAFFLILM